MKKQFSAALAATLAVGCMSLAQADPTAASKAMYVSLTGADGAVPQTLTVSVSGACSGSFTLQSFTMAALWNVDQINNQPDPNKQLAGAVGIFPFTNLDEEEVQFPVMAGNFGPKSSYSLVNNKKGETFKVTAQAYIDSGLLYDMIAAQDSITCKSGQGFADTVAKYPSLGVLFDPMLPFDADAPQYFQKSSKTSADVKTDGNHENRGAIVSYKNTTTITGYFNSVSECKLKGTMDEPANLSCKAGKPINVKLSIKAKGTDMTFMDIGI